MRKRGAGWLTHYVDDFMTVGPPGSEICKNNMNVMYDTCEMAGLTVEPEGPATKIGVVLDSDALEVRLTAEKLSHLRATLASWRGRKACRKRELLSLVGTLTHAGRAVKAGRSFIRRLIDLEKSTRRMDQHIPHLQSLHLALHLHGHQMLGLSL